MDSIQAYFEQEAQLFRQLDLEQINRVVDQLDRARNEGRRIFLFGNGGSAATASHFACDLGKSTIQPGRPRFQVIALNDNIPLLTAYANDIGYDHIFAEPLVSLATRGDLAIAFSASGNSPNVLRAIAAATQIGMTTIGFTGFTGGELQKRVQLNVHVPSHSFGQVEDVHLALTHAICEILKLRHIPH